MENVHRKIVYILPRYDEKTDTHLFYNYELIRALSGRMNIFVVIENAEGNINLNAPFIVQKNKNGFMRFFELYFILRRLKKEGYENFYVHYSYYGALASLLAGGRVFYWNRGMPWLFRRGFLEERVFRYVLKRAVLVTGPEGLAKEYVRRYGVKEYKILSNWIDVERFRHREDKSSTKSWFGISKDTKVILFAHHLSERKGADLVSKIASYFGGDDIVFFVAGDGPYRGELEIEARDSHVPIKILGQIPNRDLAAYFQASDVFLMPSREEGSPHVLLESMAAGTPFVATDVGGVREIVPPGFEEFLSQSEDVQGMADKIKKLLSDRTLYEKFREAGMELSAKFNLELGVKEFISLFS